MHKQPIAMSFLGPDGSSISGFLFMLPGGFKAALSHAGKPISLPPATRGIPFMGAKFMAIEYADAMGEEGAVEFTNGLDAQPLHVIRDNVMKVLEKEGE